MYRIFFSSHFPDISSAGMNVFLLKVPQNKTQGREEVKRQKLFGEFVDNYKGVEKQQPSPLNEVLPKSRDSLKMWSLFSIFQPVQLNESCSV